MFNFTNSKSVAYFNARNKELPNNLGPLRVRTKDGEFLNVECKRRNRFHPNNRWVIIGSGMPLLDVVAAYEVLSV
jgi:hypothetical protein